jgi:hypothetical protein
LKFGILGFFYSLNAKLNGAPLFGASEQGWKPCDLNALLSTRSTPGLNTPLAVMSHELTNILILYPTSKKPP